jgi:hypothetical protein
MVFIFKGGEGMVLGTATVFALAWFRQRHGSIRGQETLHPTRLKYFGRGAAQHFSGRFYFC